jgi:hypothetical protein
MDLLFQNTQYAWENKWLKINEWQYWEFLNPLIDFSPNPIININLI